MKLTIVLLVAMGLVLQTAQLSAEESKDKPHDHGGTRQHPDPERGAPLFGNLGAYHRAVTTKSEQAQRYFDQGLTLVYAFNHAEAVRSFGEAARLDQNCAM